MMGNTVLIVLSLLLIGCGSGSSSSGATDYGLDPDLEPLHDQVMEIHDEMMPKLSEITAYQTDLRESLDSMRGISELRLEMLEANRVLADLNRAEDAMWSWMHGFSALDTIPPPDQESWLRQELIEVQQMKDVMLSGIEKAEQYFDE